MLLEIPLLHWENSLKDQKEQPLKKAGVKRKIEKRG
jgi:hypothetical protein